MRKYLILSSLIIATVLSASAFSMGGPAPAEKPQVAASAPAAPAASTPVSSGSVQEIKVLAKQFEYIPNTIEVKNGIPVRIILSSDDVTHGFAIDALKISATVEKGKDTIVEFTPQKTGTYDFYCTVFCGWGHMGMRGKLIVK